MKNLLIIVALVSTSAFAQVPAVTPSSAPLRVHLPRVPKAKLFRANPHRLAAIRTQGTNPYDAPDDDYICSGTARRPRIAPIRPDLDDNEVSDYVQVRLAVARARALEKYRAARA
jgi:hypothetical protein